jgi:hypothetical protein
MKTTMKTLLVQALLKNQPLFYDRHGDPMSGEDSLGPGWGFSWGDYYKHDYKCPSRQRGSGESFGGDHFAPTSSGRGDGCGLFNYSFYRQRGEDGISCGYFACEETGDGWAEEVTD